MNAVILAGLTNLMMWVLVGVSVFFYTGSAWAAIAAFAATWCLTPQTMS